MENSRSTSVISPSTSVSAGLGWVRHENSTVAKEIPPLSLWHWAASLSGYLGFSSPFTLRSPLGPRWRLSRPCDRLSFRKGLPATSSAKLKIKGATGNFFQNLTVVPSNVLELWLLEASDSMLVQMSYNSKMPTMRLFLVTLPVFLTCFSSLLPNTLICAPLCDVTKGNDTFP